MNSLTKIKSRIENFLKHNSNHKKESKNYSAILLIDSDGLSHYTCYLARGLSKYRDIILYGFSRESYEVTGAAKEKRIRFSFIGKKLPKGIMPIKVIGHLFFLSLTLPRVLIASKYDIVHIQGHVPAFFFFMPLLKLRRKQIFIKTKKKANFLDNSRCQS